MSSLSRATKSQHIHRERHQPKNRKHLGYLEKKKDYKTRANDFQRKETTLRVLRKKALDRNPDEFHFHMINSQMNEGVHYEKRKDEEHTPDQLKLMQSQDLNYVNYKRKIENSKIDRLKANLHLIDVTDKPKNKHTFFTDTKAQARKFNFAKKFNTLPEFLDRSYNCPNLERLKDQVIKVDEKSVGQVTYLRDQSYDQLMKRMEREKLLSITGQKMEMKKKLMDKKATKPVKKVNASSTSAGVFKWRMERKR